MTTSNQVRAFILRDGEGNYYLLSEQDIKNAKVPADKVPALQNEFGDTGGFIFGPNFLNSFNVNIPTNNANLNQNQQQNAQNFGLAVGGFAAVGPQTATNIGVQQGTINQGNL